MKLVLLPLVPLVVITSVVAVVYEFGLRELERKIVGDPVLRLAQIEQALAMMWGNDDLLES